MTTTLVKAALVAASVAMLVATASRPTMPPRDSDGPMLPRAELFEVLLAGNRAIAADFYWILLTHHVGKANTGEEYRHTFRYADLVTDLDPDFLSAYQFAAAAIPYNRGRETWVNGKETRAIIEKGLGRFPRDVALRFYLSHALMYFDREYLKAADVLRDLSKEPGTPPFLSHLASRLYAQAGSFEVGLEYARSMRDGATDEDQRRFFDRRAREIEAEQVLTRVDEAAWAFFKQRGRQATGVHELLAEGLLPVPPVDPLGGDIVIDDFGRARSTAAPFRLELFEDYSTKLLALPPASE